MMDQKMIRSLKIKQNYHDIGSKRLFGSNVYGNCFTLVLDFGQTANLLTDRL